MRLCHKWYVRFAWKSAIKREQTRTCSWFAEREQIIKIFQIIFKSNKRKYWKIWLRFEWFTALRLPFGLPDGRELFVVPAEGGHASVTPYFNVTLFEKLKQYSMNSYPLTQLDYDKVTYVHFFIISRICTRSAFSSLITLTSFT